MKTICFYSLLFILSYGVPQARAEESWVQVRTPHFLVISNGNATKTREVAAGFEQMQSFFATTYPNLRMESAEPTIVLAAKDENTMKELIGNTRNGSAVILGQFMNGWEKDYAIVQVNRLGDGLTTIYHEYIHKLLHMNFTRLPRWADEGMAEFYSLTSFRKNETIVGMPSPRLRQLNGRMSHSIQQLVDPAPGSLRRMSGDDILNFYAEAWALTHFLVMSPEMGAGRPFDAYLALLQKGVDSGKAFEQAIGKFADVQKQFDNYFRKYTLPVGVLNRQFVADPSSLSVKTMSVGETAALLGGYFTFTDKLEEAQKRLTATLNGDAQSAVGHENMGFLDFARGRKAEAQKEFDVALARDPSSYLSLYYRTMLANEGKNDTESLTKLDAAMQKVIELNPRFAPAFVVQSRIYIRRNQLNSALQAAVEARNLAPDRAGYWTNIAAILYMLHDYANALRIGNSVVERWSASDSAEALGIVERIRSASATAKTSEDQARETDAMKYAENTSAVEGTIQTISCTDERPTEVDLRVGDRNMTFSIGKEFVGLGRSDTLWIGVERFSVCHHAQGLRAIARYKTNPNSTAPAELKWLEVLDKLIPMQQTSALVN